MALFHAGVFLSIRGSTVANDSYVDIDYIDFGSEFSLNCVTDNVDCCGPVQSQVKGDWYFPNHTRVGGFTENSNSGRSRDIFIRNRGQSVVRLHRFDNPSERGRFYCEVPNSHGINQTIFINICELIILSM